MKALLGTASLFLCATLVLWVDGGPVNACDPNRKSAPWVDEFSATWGTVSWDTSDQLRGNPPCPEPPCTPVDTCLTFEDNTVFVRPPEHEAAPIHQPGGSGSYCFTIAKKSDTFYYHLHAAGGFHYSTSTDGITWTPGNEAFPSTGAWYSSIICPDVHFEGDGSGDMYLFFQGGGNGIGYATSTDHGRTFQDSGSPVLTSQDPDYNVRTPSVAKLGNVYYMVYNEVCIGESAPFQLATLNLAISFDRINWTPYVNNPIVVPGPCGTYDTGTTALGQLVADPNGTTLHLFYAGTGWMEGPGGNGTTRGCAKIAHAISTDRGRTWCKSGSPVLDHPPAGSQAWDTQQYFVSDYTWEKDEFSQDLLRMYYWGQGSGYEKALGVAEALATELPDCPFAGGETAVPAVRRLGTGVRLTLQPNPTANRTVISFAKGSDVSGWGTVSAYDVRGRVVRSLWSGELASLPDALMWEGSSDGGSSVAAGRYLIRLESGGRTIGASWVTIVR